MRRKDTTSGVSPSARSAEPTHLTFLLNFFDELHRRAPANK